MKENDVKKTDGTFILAYVGPWYNGINFTSHELHLAFIPNKSDDCGVLRYSKFSCTYENIVLQDWLNICLLFDEFKHVIINFNTRSILLPNDLYGHLFPILFNNNQTIYTDDKLPIQRFITKINLTILSQNSSLVTPYCTIL